MASPSIKIRVYRLCNIAIDKFILSINHKYSLYEFQSIYYENINN